MAKYYEVTLHRVVEHETVFKVEANSEEEAEEYILNGDYIEVISDNVIGDIEIDVSNIERVL